MVVAHNKSNNTRPFQCQICDKAFYRQAHLKRHAAIHLPQHPLKCLKCEKTFSRKDTLGRHALIHEENNATGRIQSIPACRPCAARRTRCSRGHPCIQCTKRDSACHYKSDVQSPVRIETTTLAPGSAEPGSIGNVPSTTATQLLPHDTVQSGSAYETHQDTDDVFDIGNIGVCDFEQQDGQTLDFDLAQAGDISSHDQRGVNWWALELHDTENWIIEQILVSDFESPSLPTTTHSSQPSNLDGAIPASGLCQSNLRPDQPQPAKVDQRAQLARTLKDMANTLAPETLLSNVTVKRYYVEGGPGRLALPGKNQNRRYSLVNSCSSEDGHTTAYTVNTTSGTEAADHHQSVGSEDYGQHILSNSMYATLVSGLQRTLCQRSLEIGNHTFPSPTDTSYFIQHYFEHFHPTISFLCPNDFVSGNVSWLVVLSVTAVGAHLARSNHGQYLHSLLAKALHSTSAKADWFVQNEQIRTLQSSGQNNIDDLAHVQASILNLILMLQNGSDELRDCLIMERMNLVARCESLELFRSSPKHGMASSYTIDTSQPDRWPPCQAKLRAGWMIWLLDILIAYQTGGNIYMSSTNLETPLPLAENYWHQNPIIHHDMAQIPLYTMAEAMEMLWIHKELPKDLSDFGHIILIHAVYRKVQEVAKQCQDRLSALMDQPATGTTVVSPDRLSLTNDIYSKWRNSACDSFDVLHWRMNAQIADSIGHERPVVAYLHLARLLLLSPLPSLQSLAAVPTILKFPLGSNSEDETLLRAREQVIRWVLQDRYKARLCLVHSGALYWHIRRYGSGGIIEPFSIFGATLVLWAYGTISQLYAEIGRRDGHDACFEWFGQTPEFSEGHDLESQTKGSSAIDTPFIYLDRPCDDEMVQNFVRNGQLMKAYISGVGDIADVSACKKILEEGVRILKGISSQTATVGTTDQEPYIWKVQERYIEALVHMKNALA